MNFEAICSKYETIPADEFDTDEDITVFKPSNLQKLPAPDVDTRADIGNDLWFDKISVYTYKTTLKDNTNEEYMYFKINTDYSNNNAITINLKTIRT